MKQSGRSLMQRIRSAKSSLENAEQSFKDNQSMRGELDLMLAEAELKNLRRKNSVPWSWSRQLLALCAAFMLVLAGFGGWYWAQAGAAKGQAPLTAGAADGQAEFSSRIDKADKQLPQSRQADVINKYNHNSSDADGSGVLTAAEQERGRAQLSEQEMRQLVRSARAELSSAN